MALTKVDQTMVSDQVFGRRNLFINGDMQISQRATTANNVSSTGYNTVDRWELSLNSAGSWNVSREESVLPAGQGFAYAQKLEVNTADSSLSAGDYAIWRQKIEGINLQHLKYGTSSAQKLTLSFWVRSNATSTFIVEFFNDNSSENKTQSQSYTISSANTWEKKTITIDGDTAHSIQNTVNAELLVYFWLAAGSNYTGGGSLNTSWSAVDTVGNNVRAVGQFNLANSSGNTFYITGVQLEVGDNATPFEHLTFQDQLTLCQRYYYQTEGQVFYSGYGTSADTYSLANVELPTVMRANPTVTDSDTANGTNFSTGAISRFIIYGAATNSAAAAARGKLYANSEL